MKPGITGWAQVNGRNAAPWEEHFALDVWYVDHWSLGLDLEIHRATLWKTIKRDGSARAGMRPCRYSWGPGQRTGNRACRAKARGCLRRRETLGEAIRSAIVRTTDRDQWLACMQSAGAADVYYLPAYHQLYEFQGVQCLAYAASVGGKSLFHPFLLRPIARIGAVDVAAGLKRHRDSLWL